MYLSRGFHAIIETAPARADGNLDGRSAGSLASLAAYGKPFELLAIPVPFGVRSPSQLESVDVFSEADRCSPAVTVDTHQSATAYCATHC